MNKYILNEIELYQTEEFPKFYHSVLILLKDTQKGGWVLSFNKKRHGWEFPGGHVESGETWQQTAIRETKEEVQAQLKDLKYYGFYVLPSGHTTLITAANVDYYISNAGDFETENTTVFPKLPDDLTFKDGLYQFIISHFFSTSQRYYEINPLSPPVMG